MTTESEFNQSYKSEVAALRERIDRGDTQATDELIEPASEQGDIGELRRLADAGNPTAIDQLIELATELGDLAELRRLSDSGSDTATDQLIEHYSAINATLRVVALAVAASASPEREPNGRTTRHSTLTTRSCQNKALTSLFTEVLPPGRSRLAEPVQVSRL